MPNYGVEIEKCRYLVKYAESIDNEYLKNAMRRLIQSYEGWESSDFESRNRIPSVVNLHRNNLHHIDRLVTLCKALAQKELEGKVPNEGIRAEIAGYLRDVSDYESESNAMHRDFSAR